MSGGAGGNGGGGGGGADGSSEDREAGVTGGGQDSRPTTDGNASQPSPLDGALLRQLLRKPVQVQPSPAAAPLPHQLHQPHRDPVVVPSFPFPPHKLIAPPKAAADQFPPSPEPADSPSPPGIIRPVADHRRFQEEDVFSAGQKNGHFQNGRYSGSWRRGERSGGNSQLGFWKAMHGGGAGIGGRISSRNESGAGFAESGRRGKVYMVRPHGSFQWIPSHSEKGREGMMEERRPPTVTQRRKVTVEWVPVNGRQEGKNKSKTADDRKKRGKEVCRDDIRSDDQLALKISTNQVDQNECTIGTDEELSEEESDSDKFLLYKLLEDGNSSIESIVEQDGVEGFDSKNDTLGEEDVLADQVMDSLKLLDEPIHRSLVRKSNASRIKELRLDPRGQQVSSPQMRIYQRCRKYRDDIDTLSPFFLSVYESLIPAEEEKAKQNKLLQSLQKSINKEWPNCQMHLYGSCANTFGFSNSDIDICLVIDDSSMSRNEMLLKLAEILQSDNLQNVQALTNARVPIVKMMDPKTGISCDICINNLFAMVNTKLLKDYAQIDERLHQLAFIVKHWARQRAINATYRGTLSSYAYVLMCIHFLQMQKPAILPCLQEMEATFVFTVGDTECAYFDQVEKLNNFGAQNKENIAQLLWAFFHYWAYHHDYKNDVISVRTGRIISKLLKDWTRRTGNDHHLICIEDPFETSHDLGRMVDKRSIKVLRVEFEQAADILQYDPNPSVTLFEPYIPSPMQN